MKQRGRPQQTALWASGGSLGGCETALRAVGETQSDRHRACGDAGSCASSNCGKIAGSKMHQLFALCLHEDCE